MTETNEHPSPAELRNLSTLREMSTDDLMALSQQLLVCEEPKGAVLLQHGATEDNTLYLLEGSCRLVAEDGKIKLVKHTDPSAHAPLARLRPSHYRVVAESRVRFLRIDNALLEEARSDMQQSSGLSLGAYEVEEEDDLAQMGAENRLTLQIYEDLNCGKLLLPSLPHVAIRIGEAVQDEHSDARRVAGLIETDPAIAAKLLKAANSARYGGVSRIGSVAEAVARLGMHDTQMLVIAFVLRELFRTNDKKLEQRMFALWEHSRRIAALAQVLADKVGGFNPHEALLAGLIHDIGSVAVLGYARGLPEVVGNSAALESSLNALRSQLSAMILSQWRLPDGLVTAAKEAENWYRDRSGPADYADLVIAAQLHEGIGGDIDAAQVPALGRLGLSAADIDSGLELLHQHHDEVAAARRLLAG
ncbi:MAG: HDOD domain-containing protein [Chromatiaceae bacterium]|jgi:HD-like signal output (HDOD) protein